MYTEYMYSDSLAHQGIPGMKWGVRRYQNPDGTWTEEGKRRYGKKIEKIERKEEKKKRREDNKNRHLMTDDELDSKIKRMKKEKELNDLTKKEVNEGREYAKDLLKETGKRVVPAVATVAVLYAGKKVVEHKLDAKVNVDSSKEPDKLRGLKEGVELANDIYKYAVKKK